jgi:hypothetical protein
VRVDEACVVDANDVSAASTASTPGKSSPIGGTPIVPRPGNQVVVAEGAPKRLIGCRCIGRPVVSLYAGVRTNDDQCEVEAARGLADASGVVWAQQSSAHLRTVPLAARSRVRPPALGDARLDDEDDRDYVARVFDVDVADWPEKWVAEATGATSHA